MFPAKRVIPETCPPPLLVKQESMETEPPPRELPILGGHLALDFANTVDDPLGPARHDHASTYDDLVRWAIRTQVIDEAQASWLLGSSATRTADADAALASAHQLRDTLNHLFGAVADGTSDAAAHWPRLRPYVTTAYSTAALHAHRWAWPHDDDLTVILHPIAVVAADLLISDRIDRLRRCARCPWLFLDTSRNHSRRWCDMNDCGRAQKIERYVARRAAARQARSGTAGNVRLDGD
jgi:predicted RNA-binding Zn ribbon-like protein